MIYHIHRDVEGGYDVDMIIADINGVPGIKATYSDEDGTHTIYTTDFDRLPQNDDEADEFMDGLD